MFSIAIETTLKNVLYDWGWLNIALFRAINETTNSTFDAFMVWGTRASDHVNFPFFIAFLIAVAWLTALSPRNAKARSSAWLTASTLFALSYLAGAAIVSILKTTLDFQRPPLALGEESIRLLLPAEYHHGFPSGHVFFATTFAASVWLAVGTAGRLLAMLFVLWAALSRIKVGAHFPADVVWSCIIAVAVVAVVRAAMKVYENRLRLTSSKEAYRK